MKSLSSSRRKASKFTIGEEVFCPVMMSGEKVYLKGKVVTIVEADQAALVQFENGTARMVKFDKIAKF